MLVWVLPTTACGCGSQRFHDLTKPRFENFQKRPFFLRGALTNSPALKGLSISSYCVLHNQEEGDSVTITPSSAFLSLHTYVPAYRCTACARLSLHSLCAPITAQLVRAYHCTACASLSPHSLCAPITAQLVRAYHCTACACLSLHCKACARLSLHARLLRAYHFTACARLSLHSLCAPLALHSLCAPITAQLARAPPSRNSVLDNIHLFHVLYRSDFQIGVCPFSVKSDLFVCQTALIRSSV